MAVNVKHKTKTKSLKEPILSIRVYTSGKEVDRLLRKRGEEIVNRTAECFNLPLAYYKTIGDIILMFADDELVGIAAMEQQEDKRYYLNTVCTFIEHRGKGYCSWFMPQILAIEPYNSNVVYLEVDKTNAAAIRCYKKAGFYYKSEYDGTYDAYEWRRPLNILVYSMACNHPGLPEETGAVSLELGVMADIGKLVSTAYNTIHTNSTQARWNITIYLDGHPGDYIMTMQQHDNGVGIKATRTNVQDRGDTCAERMGKFLREHSMEKADNMLIVGGHGMIYENNKQAEFWPVSYREDGSIDTLTIREIAHAINRNVRGGKVRLLVLDSCCLSTLEVLETVNESCEYLVAYQSEGPWGGFLSQHTLMHLLSSPDMKTAIIRCMEEYKRAADSEENPSPITLMRTKYFRDLLNEVEELSHSKNRTYQDLLTYARTTIKSTRQRNAFKRIFDSVVVAYLVPNTYRPNGEENGLSHLV